MLELEEIEMTNKGQKTYKNLEEGRDILMELYPERKAEFAKPSFSSSRFDSIEEAIEDSMYNGDYYGAETDLYQYDMSVAKQEKMMRELLHKEGYVGDMVNVGFYSGNIYPLDVQAFLFTEKNLPEVMTVEVVKSQLLALADKWLHSDGTITVYVTASQIGRFPQEKDKDFRNDEIDILVAAAEELADNYCIDIYKDDNHLSFNRYKSNR